MKLICWSACLGLLLLGGGQVFDNSPPTTQPGDAYKANPKAALCMSRIAEIDAALADLGRRGLSPADFEWERARLKNWREGYCKQLSSLGLAAPPLPANSPAASQSAEEKDRIAMLKTALSETDKFVDDEQSRTLAGTPNSRLEGLLTRRQGLADQLAKLGAPQPARKDVTRSAPVALAVPTTRSVLSRPNVPLLWDGKETVADYARRNKIADVELTAKLGTLQVQRQAVPVIMKLTLIPAGTYLTLIIHET